MIVLDTNIIMEILEQRSLHQSVGQAIAAHGSKARISLSTVTVSTVFYLAERHKISIKRTEALVVRYDYIDVLSRDVLWALDHYQQKDFEDALQIAAALREGCKTFMTLDKKLANKYGKHLNIQLIQ